MKSHLWQGQIVAHTEWLERLKTLEQSIETVLAENFDLDRFIESCDAFSKLLSAESPLQSKLIASLSNNDGLSRQAAQDTLFSIADFISKRQIKFKINNELGTMTPFTSQRMNTAGNVFEKWEPLGLIVQILSGNDNALPILSAFEGLMTGNLNILKLSHQSSNFTQEFFTEFCNFKETSQWKNRISIINVSSKEKSILDRLYQQADGVVVWGGEESINEIKKSVPPTTRFIDWGHKISFSYVTKKEWQKTGVAKQIALDISLLDQQACSSPQCLYLEDATFQDLKDFSVILGQALGEMISKFPSGEVSDMENAEITKMSLIVKTEKSLQPGLTDILEDADGNWRIWIDSRSGLRASPLYKTIWLKPIQRIDLLKIFRPMKPYLQTVGLGCGISELFDLSRLFYASGATRIRSLGSMQDGYVGEPHDGYFALNRYVRRVSLESNIESLKTFSTINDLKKNEIQFAQFPDVLMDKVDFQNIPEQVSSQLYFKSGGSSGASKISQFTYVDYHTQMRAAANGLMAAGLDPKKDRTMNLFFGGGLYGGFLSFFTILEELKAVQFPMAAHMDYDFVGQMIKKYKVNALMGMPSYLMQMLDHNKELLTQEPIVEKIFYGGEAFSASQIEKLKNDYGVKVIKSASYGSVDMGPLGYQCEFSDNKTYHLHHQIHHLEVLKLDSLLPTDENEVGRLIFSTHSREDQNLFRYDVGDLGKRIQQDCPCGRLSPRFELHGRYGDIFRAAGTFLNYNHLVSILSDKLGIANEMQILLKKAQNKEEMIIVIGLDSNSPSDQLEADFLRSLSVRGLSSLPEVTQILVKSVAVLDEVVNFEKFLDVKISLVPSDSLARNHASGKLSHILDQRGL